MCLTWLYQYLGEIKNDFGNAKVLFKFREILFFNFCSQEYASHTKSET